MAVSTGELVNVRVTVYVCVIVGVFVSVGGVPVQLKVAVGEFDGV